MLVLIIVLIVAWVALMSFFLLRHSREWDNFNSNILPRLTQKKVRVLSYNPMSPNGKQVWTIVTEDETLSIKNSLLKVNRIMDSEDFAELTYKPVEPSVAKRLGIPNSKYDCKLDIHYKTIG